MYAGGSLGLYGVHIISTHLALKIVYTTAYLNMLFCGINNQFPLGLYRKCLWLNHFVYSFHRVSQLLPT